MFSVVNVRVIKNFFSLAVLQGGNYLLPLVLIPFLVRVLGMSTFGDWVFAISFVSIFRTFVNYGFDLTATRAVSVNRDDRMFVSDLCATVVIIRLVICVLSCLILLGLAVAFRNIWSVVVLAQLSMLVLVGEALFPAWLYQGMENMSRITQLRLGYRVLFVFLVFLLVRGPQDVLLIPIVEAVGSLLAGLIALYLAYQRYGLSFRWPRYSFLMRELKDGVGVFASYLAVHFYMTINTVLLGFFQGTAAVAQYSIAEKVYYAIRGIFSPVMQALFPTLSLLYEQDFNTFRRAARSIALVFFAALVGLAIIVFFSAESIVLLIAGQPEPVATRALQILSVTLTLGLGSLFSPLLVIQKKNNLLALVTFSTVGVNLAIVFPLIHYYGAIGIAMALFITQLFQLVVQLIANAEVLTSKPRTAIREGVPNL